MVQVADSKDVYDVVTDISLLSAYFWIHANIGMQWIWRQIMEMSISLNSKY